MKRRNDLVAGPRDKAVQAIKEDRKADAMMHVSELYEDFRPIHDRYVESINSLLTFISKRLGEEAVEEAARCYVEQTATSIFSRMKAMNHEQLVGTLVNLHRKHYSDFYVEENDDRTIITISGCNVGARLLQAGIAQREGGLTSRGWDWSFNRAGVPYYCVHAHIFNELFKKLELPVEVQWGKQYDDEGNPTGETCRYIIQKTAS
ncbi:MAG: hypothetical protein ACE5PO_05030 [Candidatus Bathyarchaeia archaeon]